jgi:membrane-associated protease RseP (regulator of RpoE activity)
MKCLVWLSILFAVRCVAASEAAPAVDKSVVEMKPYKVISRGWNVYWTLSFPVFGSVADVTFKEVDSGSFAGKAGIREGDRLLSINGKPVKGMKERDMERLLWPASAVTLSLEVQSQDLKSTRVVELRYPAPEKLKGSDKR